METFSRKGIIKRVISSSEHADLLAEHRDKLQRAITRRAKQDSGGHDIHGKFGGSLSFRPNFAVMSEAVKCYISEAWPTDRWVPDACARTCNLVRVQGST